ncbi:MAG: CoA ester lyase [Lachnospiraceae bacterium]|nr:CoA ester lyase [Lachnospiraceae bacterium]
MYRIPDSWLFVPAAEKFLSKPDRFAAADNVIFDLEDSLKDSEKEEGLKLLCAMMEKTGAVKDQGIFIRLNKDRLRYELEALKDLETDGFMIPKFEDTGDLDGLEGLIGKKKIVPLVETCRGVVNLEKISGDARIYAVALGGEDYCSGLGVETNDNALFLARAHLVLYAKAAGKPAIDTISTEYKDLKAFDKELKKTADLGFDGKLMIHPAQADASQNLKKSVPKEDIEAIIKEFDSRKEGAVIINGRLYERPHIERLKKIIKQ